MADVTAAWEIADRVDDGADGVWRHAVPRIAAARMNPNPAARMTVILAPDTPVANSSILTYVTAALAGLTAILVAFTLLWILSVRLRNASIIDACWGMGFVLLAWLYCGLSPALTWRSWLVVSLITLW